MTMKKIICALTFIIAISAYAQQKEIIDWDKASVNNKLTLTISKRDFEKIYKKADSIVKPDYSKICGTDADSNFRYLYYKGAMFEEDNGIMNFRHMVFTRKNGMFFMHNRLRFDAGTSSKDISELFPESFKTLERAQFGPMKDLLVTTIASENADGARWFLYFSKGMLVAIEAHFECEQ